VCLILFSYKTHPEYKLVIAANRDEFYDRPTIPASFWDDHENVLAGRDLEAGGTWMGINRSGGLCMLTNYRDMKNIKAGAPSRGKLVSDFLIAQPGPDSYLQPIDLLYAKYNGYNLVLGTVDDLWYYSNIQRKIYMLGSGIYGLSNSFLDTPWPKLVKGKRKLEQILEEAHFDPEDLFKALYDDDLARDEELPDTGIGLDKERMLSSMFIKSQDYGTRCSTILLVDNNNRALFMERTFDTKTFEYQTKSYELNLGRK